jgi:hypothetical protein
MKETIHVVQPFDRQKGGLIPRMASQRATGQEAALLAQRLASNHAGVVAYSMDVDEEAGDYGDPRVLFTAGEVPELA